MFRDSHKGASGRHVLTHSSPSPSSGFSNAVHDPASTGCGPPAIVCPVPVCSLVFEGGAPDGYLWRHLRRPGIHGRTGGEKATWLHLHKIEHDRLLATR
ncbi:hypothetical protein HOY80DRAFT_1139576, partial [Tuber brumale]